MKRRLHRLFRRLHRFEPYELRLENEPMPGPFGGSRISDDPYAAKVWYVGYRCSCGEPGYMVGPISRD